MVRKQQLVYVLVAPCVPMMGSGRQAYTYHAEMIDDRLVDGRVVRMPFGKRKILGVVLQIGIKRPRYPTKPITTVLDTTLTSQQMQFAKLLAKSMHGGLGFTLRLFIPHSL